MRIEVDCASDTGLVREHNEDNFAYDEALGLTVLADGMGGYQAGEIASEIAVTTILSTMQQALKDLPASKRSSGYHPITVLLEQAVLKANKAIYQAAEENPAYRGMGTTVVASVVHDNIISIAHVGDSRLYRLRGSSFRPITMDHSVLQELINCGLYTPEQARRSPNKNLVTRALGVSDTVSVDIQEQRILSEDVYLLCSDGLNDLVEDNDIHQIMNTIVKKQSSLHEVNQQLIQAANNQGGNDNISVMLMRQANYTLPPHYNWLQQFARWWRD